MTQGRSVVGMSVPRIDALAKVTGRAKYCMDYKEAGTLFAKILRSPYPHARILGINTDKAEMMRGVRVVITGKDQPDRRIGLMIFDQYPIAKDIVRYQGEPIAVVVADTAELAEEALDLIDVEYEELPAVFDAEEAMQPNCPVILHPELPSYHLVPIGQVLPQRDPNRPNVYQHRKIRYGDLERGFQESFIIVENRYYVPRVNHSCLEPHAFQAWVDSEGVLTIRSTQQGAGLAKPLVCQFLGLPLSKVRMLESYLGGGFGGKDCGMYNIIASLLALKTHGKPVTLCLSRNEVFSTTTNKPPLVVYVKDGVKKDGTLVAREMKVILDSGGYSQFASLVVRNCNFGAVGTYKIPNFKWDSFGVYTNNSVSGPYRGFNVQDVVWAIEQQMDIIAEKLGIDSVKLRKHNMLQEGDKNVLGEITHSIGAKECLDKVAEWLNSGTPAFAGATGPWRRGKGLAVGCKHTLPGIPSCIHVKVHPNIIEVRHSLDEMGQGLNTIVAQVAAEEFGVPLDKVKVVWGDTAFMPWDWASGGSRSTWQLGLALQRACSDAKRQIFEIAAAKLGVSPDDLKMNDSQVYTRSHPSRGIRISELFNPMGFVSNVGEILGKGEYNCPKPPEDPETGQCERPASHYCHVAHGVEVAVNIETGEVKVERITVCFDMGYPMNPKMCEQQLEGGIGMGIGNVVFEELRSVEGTIINPNYQDYHLPTTMEIPSQRSNNIMMAPVPHREGPYGAKAMGEGVIVTVGAAIANAVYNATGVRMWNQPISRETLLKAIWEKEKHSRL